MTPSTLVRPARRSPGRLPAPVRGQVQETVFVDNGGDRETVDVLRQIESAHDNVKVFYNAENVGIAAAALLIVLGYVPWLPRLVAHANLVLDPAHVTFRLGPVLQALGIAAPSGDVQVALQWGALAGAIVACAAIWGAWRSWGRSADMAGAAVVLVLAWGLLVVLAVWAMLDRGLTVRRQLVVFVPWIALALAGGLHALEPKRSRLQGRLPFGASP